MQGKGALLLKGIDELVIQEYPHLEVRRLADYGPIQTRLYRPHTDHYAVLDPL
jgi:hypothetical protein